MDPIFRNLFADYERDFPSEIVAELLGVEDWQGLLFLDRQSRPVIGAKVRGPVGVRAILAGEHFAEQKSPHLAPFETVDAAYLANAYIAARKAVNTNQYIVRCAGSHPRSREFQVKLFLPSQDYEAFVRDRVGFDNAETAEEMREVRDDPTITEAQDQHRQWTQGQLPNVDFLEEDDDTQVTLFPPDRESNRNGWVQFKGTRQFSMDADDKRVPSIQEACEAALRLLGNQQAILWPFFWFVMVPDTEEENWVYLALVIGPEPLEVKRQYRDKRGRGGRGPPRGGGRGSRGGRGGQGSYIQAHV